MVGDASAYLESVPPHGLDGVLSLGDQLVLDDLLQLRQHLDIHHCLMDMEVSLQSGQMFTVIQTRCRYVLHADHAPNTVSGGQELTILSLMGVLYYAYE